MTPQGVIYGVVILSINPTFYKNKGYYSNVVIK